MKTCFQNTLLPLLFVAVLAFTSCSDEEIKFNPTEGLTKVTEGYALGAGAKLEIWAGEELFAGYNQLYVALYDSITNTRITESRVEFTPIMNMHTMSHSCPVENPQDIAVNELFPGSALFTMPSGDMGSWTLVVSVLNYQNNRAGKAKLSVDVQQKAFPAGLSFSDPVTRKKYYVGYAFPKGMKVGINDFEIVAYTFTNGSFVPEENLQIQLNPEMPSMDHGSPNNVSPIHLENGHYVGKVNFTMTGEWRLNLTFSDGDAPLGLKHFDVAVK